MALEKTLGIIKPDAVAKKCIGKILAHVEENGLYIIACKMTHLSKEDANYKGQLIEYCHSHNLSTPKFETIESHGPHHERTFTIKVSITRNKQWVGIGTTKKAAEQDAAKRAIKSIL